MSDLHARLMALAEDALDAALAMAHDHTAADDLSATRDALSAALREVADDAARYRWLREEAQSVPGPCAYAPWAGPPLFGEELDAAIDSARSAK